MGVVLVAVLGSMHYQRRIKGTLLILTVIKVTVDGLLVLELS